MKILKRMLCNILKLCTNRLTNVFLQNRRVLVRMLSLPCFFYFRFLESKMTVLKRLKINPKYDHG